MANYNNPNIGVQQMPNLMGQPQTPIQFPYGSNNMLLSNTPYDNYIVLLLNQWKKLTKNLVKVKLI